MLFKARRYDESIKVIESYLETDPNSAGAYGDLWRVYRAKGDEARAFDAFIKYHEKSNRVAELDQYKTTYAQKGWPAVLSAYKEVLKKARPAGGYWPGHYTLGAVAAMAGDRELAFESLDLANKYKSAFISGIKADPSLDSLRDDPRFADLLKRSGY